ncbi:hypothetical protein Cal7507_5317 [Calothrix sp. PCC 7507]|nr:hypothetical protein Cal7507_5317 [Calothrix sp. PCC 7507]
MDVEQSHAEAGDRVFTLRSHLRRVDTPKNPSAHPANMQRAIF